MLADLSWDVAMRRELVAVLAVVLVGAWLLSRWRSGRRLAVHAAAA